MVVERTTRLVMPRKTLAPGGPKFGLATKHSETLTAAG